MMRNWFVLVVAGLVAASAAQAGEYGFKGVALGSGLALIANNPKFVCHAVTTPIADRVCSLRKDETETLAGISVDSLFYFYDQSVLTSISISLDEKHFQPVVDAFTGKYGPSALTRQAIKNLKGVAFENQIHAWHSQGESILIERYAGRLDRSSVRISEDGAAVRIKQRRTELAKNPHLDL